MPLTSTPKNAIAWTGMALALALALWLLAPVLTPFLVAMVLAYALSPLVDRLSRPHGWGMPRALAVVLVEVLFMAAVGSLFLLLVPIMAHEMTQLHHEVPLLLAQANAVLQPLLTRWGFDISVDTASLQTMLLGHLNDNLEDILMRVVSSLKLGSSVALMVLGSVLLIPVVLFYLLMDWHALMAKVSSWVPPRLRPGLTHFADEADQILGQYLRGQSLVMLIMAFYYSVALSLFGLDLAVPIGIFTGLAIFVPYIGFGLGLIMATLAGLLDFASVEGPTKAFIMVGVVYGAGQILEGFFITPRLLGERIGLHPLAVIFALLAFGELFGFAGVLVALPASAVLLVAIRRLRARYLASTLYQGPA
jgi:predicted PurR-regulated permease PerM